MKRTHSIQKIGLALGVLTALLLACAPGSTPTADPAPTMDSGSAVQPRAAAPTTNLTEGCVTQYNPDVDYFPDKVQFDYAEGLTVEYFNHYKVVTVLNPWAGAEQTFQYVLVQCGTPAPDGYPEAQVIQAPVESVIALSTTLLPGLRDLDLLDRLVAVEEFDYVNTEAVRERIEAGAIAEVGSSPNMNMELVLDHDPDLVMTFAYGSPDYDNHPKLLEAGLSTAVTAGYMETSPLGRAEWLKFTALFFNKETQASELFAEIAERYVELAALAADVDERPTVLTGINRGDAWRVSGGNSYFAQYLADAGADYLWADDESIGSVPLDFEAVYERAADADYWLPNTGRWTTLADVANEDPRYEGFAAYENGRIYNNNGRVNEFGGNDYWESGVAHPDLILADLIAIFHPDLLPEHELLFFRHVGLEE